MNPAVATTRNDLTIWRTRLLARLLWVVAVAGWAVGIPSVVLAVYEGLWPLAMADVVALVWVTVLYRSRVRRLFAHTVQLLALLYLLGIVLLFTVGHVSQIYLMAIPVLAVLLLSLRVALVCLALNAVVLAAAGYALPIDPGTAQFSAYPLLRWIAIALNSLLIDLILTVACAYLLDGMEGALARQRAGADRLAYVAVHDALTALPNRQLLADRIEHAVGKAARDQHLVGVVLLDLDRFKDINDSHGHEHGDILIKAVAQRLLAAVRSGDTVARLGGDEFVVLIPDVDSETALLPAVERVLQAVDGSYAVGAHLVHVSASVGVAVAPRDGHHTTELLKHADAAMYRAKESGGNCFRFFQSEMNERLEARLALEADLRGAIERQELVLYYQPRVQAIGGGCLSAEALVRWQHPQWGLVSPARFIPVAEDSGLIVPMGAWVLDTAATQLAAWQQRYPRLRLSVNLSAREFRQEALAQRLQAAARQVVAGSLEVEVTESLVMHDLEAAQSLLGAVRSQGMSVALDDFGTGFSSLAYLKALPLDVLKIDQSFVAGLEHDAKNRAIVKTIVELADNLQLATVAEGVETQDQAAVLRELGVDELQGYLFARPLPAEAFADWLHTHYSAG